MPHLEVITPHALDIIPDPAYGEPLHLPSNTQELGTLRADEPCVEKLGSITLGESVVPIGEITYGEAVGVPPHDPDAYYVTSKLSISAVLRTPGLQDLAPRLLYPFGAVYDPQTGKCLGAKGLALPVLRPGNGLRQGDALPELPAQACELVNTCPYPFKLYDTAVFDNVTDDDPVAYQAATAPHPLRMHYGEPVYVPELSEQLGVPVFRPEVTGVEHDSADERWQLCHLDVPQAMGAATMHLIGGDLVRSVETGQMCGFRALNRIAPHHFDESIF